MSCPISWLLLSNCLSLSQLSAYLVVNDYTISETFWSYSVNLLFKFYVYSVLQQVLCYSLRLAIDYLFIDDNKTVIC
jgi:hypothetical protein